jgi:predicted CxxxxCH...CXXCH cytochrome family protein
VTATTAVYGGTDNQSNASNYGFDCGNCHPLNLSEHGDGIVEVELYNAASPAGSLKAMNQASASYSVTPGTTQNGTCSGVYCHSDGSNGASSNFVTAPAWNTTITTTNTCGQCHNNPPQYAGQAHYTASGFMGKEGGHLVGVHFDNIFTGSYGLATPGTGGTSSHGNSGTATTMTCYICHYGEVSSTTIDTYALNNLTAGSSAMQCAACHTSATTPPLQSGVIADKSKHVTGTKFVAIAPAFSLNSKAQLRTSSLPSGWTRNVGYKVSGAYDNSTMNATDYNSSTKTCTTTCHIAQPVTWGTTNVTCVTCHTGL